jgi:hypothetical protein
MLHAAISQSGFSQATPIDMSGMDCKEMVTVNETLQLVDILAKQTWFFIG